MKLRNRFLLVAFGLLAFVILMPVLVLFTSGYQIDWKNHKIVKTGALVIRTQPTRAEIFLTDKKIDGVTPETIRFLLPGEYNIRVEKDGYQSWTKRLAINPQFATWVNLDRDFLTLFAKQPQQISETAASFTSLSRNGTELAYIQNNQLNIYNVASQTTQNLGDISNLNVPFTFTDNLSWENASQATTYFRNNAANLALDLKTIKQVQTDGNNFALLSSDQLYSIVDKTPVALDRSVSGFYLEGENLWYIQNQFLKQYNFRTRTNSTVFSNLPLSVSSQIIRGEGHTFLILNNSLYALNDTLEKIYDGATYANYDSTAHLLLFADANEILLYNPARKNTDLILRSISQVTHPILNFYTGYVFFGNENKIKAIELDGRDHRNIYTISELKEGGTNFAVTNDGTILTVFNNNKIDNYRIR
jgi:hypothetical protein